MHAYKSYIFVVSRSEGRATQRLPSRDVLAQAFPAFKVFTHAQLITRLYIRSGEGLGSEASAPLYEFAIVAH